MPSNMEASKQVLTQKYKENCASFRERTLSDTLWEGHRGSVCQELPRAEENAAQHMYTFMCHTRMWTAWEDGTGVGRGGAGDFCSSFQLMVSGFFILYISCFIKIFLAMYRIKPRASHRTRRAFYHRPTSQVLCLRLLEEKLLLLKRITSLQKVENLLWKPPKGNR